MNLQEIQNAIVKAVCDSQHDAVLNDHLEQVNAPGIRVYRNSYLATLEKQLLRRWSNFARHCSSICSHSADDFFRTFIVERPPVHSDLDRYGEGFIDFVGERGLTASEQLELDCILRLDQACFDLLHAKGNEQSRSYQMDGYKIGLLRHQVVASVSSRVAKLMKIEISERVHSEGLHSVVIWIRHESFQMIHLGEDAQLLISAMNAAMASAESIFESIKEERALEIALGQLVNSGLVSVTN
jgi:hypothetical protein